MRLSAGSLFANVMNDIPLHHGGRAAHQIERLGQPRKERNLSATELRWQAFRQYVVPLDLEFDPPLAPRRPLTMRHHIIPNPIYCASCGEPYIARKGRGHAGCKPKLEIVRTPEERSAAALGRVVYLDQFRRRA